MKILQVMLVRYFFNWMFEKSFIMTILKRSGFYQLSVQQLEKCRRGHHLSDILKTPVYKNHFSNSKNSRCMPPYKHLKGDPWNFMILIAKCILIKSTLLKCIFEGAPGLHIFCEFIFIINDQLLLHTQVSFPNLLL